MQEENSTHTYCKLRDEGDQDDVKPSKQQCCVICRCIRKNDPKRSHQNWPLAWKNTFIAVTGTEQNEVSITMNRHASSLVMAVEKKKKAKCSTSSSRCAAPKGRQYKERWMFSAYQSFLKKRLPPYLWDVTHDYLPSVSRAEVKDLICAPHELHWRRNDPSSMQNATGPPQSLRKYH